MKGADKPAVHGAADLPSVIVDTYNAELRDAEGFVGDRASNRAFRAIVDELRERLRQVGEDPFGETPTEELSRKKLDKILGEGDLEAAGVVQGAIEEFATELATVITRFMRTKAWKDLERIVVGGGLRASRIGELVIGRTMVMLKEKGHAVELTPIQHHPDEAGLVGATQLVPPWMLAGHEAILALDIGGSNIRAGVVALNHKKAKDLSRSEVVELELWRHAEEKTKPTREAALERLGDMLTRLARRHPAGLAPFVGVACPGIIAPDGRIERGGQNLPGNWESARFNLPDSILELAPKIDGHDVTVVVHNDAVVQGLSQVPFLGKTKRWGVLTIGTGLGNAVFTTR